MISSAKKREEKWEARARTEPLEQTRKKKWEDALHVQIEELIDVRH